MPDAVSAALEQAAQEPLRVDSDDTEVEQHPLIEYIAADRYLLAKEAVSVSKNLGIKMNRMVPPGSV